MLICNKSHRYNIDENNKAGTSTGEVCLAQDIDLMRNVFIKIVNIDGDIQKKLKTALSEVKAMVRLEEERLNIPRIYDAFYDEKISKLYIVMEYIKGKPLKELIKDAHEDEFIRWMTDISKILSVLEKNRIYHKDIKPDNIMIDSRRNAYLIDFNISVSAPNLIDGTRFYKAPEMDKGSKYAGREKVDMFAIGVIMYEYYTGQVPKRPREYIASENALEWEKFIEPKQKNPEINNKINDCITKCMKMNPKERFSNNYELMQNLKNIAREIKNGRA